MNKDDYNTRKNWEGLGKINDCVCVNKDDDIGIISVIIKWQYFYHYYHIMRLMTTRAQLGGFGED